MRVLKLPDVMKTCALSRSSIYAYIAQNKFPASIPLGKKAVGWLEAEITAWIKGKADARHLNNARQL
jgi:prophage regulatory protein